VLTTPLPTHVNLQVACDRTKIDFQGTGEDDWSWLLLDPELHARAI
jgi:hypothetical protein